MTSFAINFDYRCPFARNANEHVLQGLADGADWDVSFRAFSLSAAHAEPEGSFAWDDPSERPNLLALAAGIAVRDRFPEHFRLVHRALFAARHDKAADLRDEAVVRAALDDGGADAKAVFAVLDDGEPFATIRAEHDTDVAALQTFGVPTFSIGDQAVFVRLMTRPGDDGALARRTVDHVLGILEHHHELNEYKHTTIAR